jgi:Uncharacterised protein family (UPF0164)
MTRLLRLCSVALAALPLGAGALAGQINVPTDNTAYGTTSAEFLLLGAGARGAALGGAYAALSTDISALYYNPAGVAQLDHPGAMVSTYSYVVSTRYTWAGIAFPMAGGARSFGFQVGNFGFSDQPVYTVDQPNGTGGTYSVSETFVGATYAQNFSDRFSAGVTGKFIADKLGEVSGTGLALDFGTSFHATTGGRPIRASFVIQNLGTTIHYGGVPLDVGVTRPPVPGQVDVPQENQPSTYKTKDFGLPVMFRVGVAVDAVANEQTRLTLLSEFNQPNNNKAGFEFGGELALSDIGKSGFFFAGRGSWTYQPANNVDVGTQAGFATGLSGKENQQGLAAGFGVGYRRSAFGLGFDYAWRDLGPLGNTNFFTLTASW